MSIYGGFGLRDQESRYNIMLFDLVLSLSARVYGTLKNRTTEQLVENKAEFKFLAHVSKLHRRLQAMEEHKRLKPFFSQAADRLNDRIVRLIGGSALYHEEHRFNVPTVMAASLDGGTSMNATEKQLPSILDGRETPGESMMTSHQTMNPRAVTLSVPRKRSPHRAYYQPPKHLGWKPMGNTTSANRSKHSQSPSGKGPDDTFKMRLNQDLSQHERSQESFADSRKSFKQERNELVSATNNRSFKELELIPINQSLNLHFLLMTDDE